MIFCAPVSARTCRPAITIGAVLLMYVEARPLLLAILRGGERHRYGVAARMDRLASYPLASVVSGVKGSDELVGRRVRGSAEYDKGHSRILASVSWSRALRDGRHGGMRLHAVRQARSHAVLPTDSGHVRALPRPGRYVRSRTRVGPAAKVRCRRPRPGSRRCAGLLVPRGRAALRR